SVGSSTQLPDPGQAMPAKPPQNRPLGCVSIGTHTAWPSTTSQLVLVKHDTAAQGFTGVGRGRRRRASSAVVSSVTGTSDVTAGSAVGAGVTAPAPGGLE